MINDILTNNNNSTFLSLNVKAPSPSSEKNFKKTLSVLEKTSITFDTQTQYNEVSTYTVNNLKAEGKDNKNYENIDFDLKQKEAQRIIDVLKVPQSLKQLMSLSIDQNYTLRESLALSSSELMNMPITLDSGDI
jgi:type II restriction/modification system DNA methylase subunit YeeA